MLCWVLLLLLSLVLSFESFFFSLCSWHIAVVAVVVIGAVVGVVVVLIVFFSLCSWHITVAHRHNVS